MVLLVYTEFFKKSTVLGLQSQNHSFFTIFWNQHHASELVFELSINPENAASLKLFEKFAQANNTKLISINKSFDYGCCEKAYRIEITKSDKNEIS